MKKLDEHNVPYVYMNYQEIGNVFGSVPDNKNLGYFLLPNSFEDEFDELKKEALIERADIREVSLSELRGDNYKKELGVISGVDDVHLDMIRKKATNKFTIAVVSEGKDNHKIYFREKDFQKVGSVIAKTSWELTGTRGEIAKERLNYVLDNIKDIKENIEKKTPVHIIDANEQTKTLEFNEKELVVYDRNKELERVSRSDPNFEAKVEIALNQMRNPMQLTKDEIELQPDERNAVVKKKNKIPTISKETLEIIEKERVAYALLQEKLGVDNDDQTKMLNGLYDGSIDFNTFSVFEDINDRYTEEELDSAKLHAEACLSELSSYNYQSFNVQDKTLERVIQELKEDKEFIDVNRDGIDDRDQEEIEEREF